MEYDPVKPRLECLFAFQLPVMLQRLTDRVLHRVQRILLILQIAECQPVKLILILDDIGYQLSVQLLLQPFTSVSFRSFPSSVFLPERLFSYALYIQTKNRG